MSGTREELFGKAGLIRHGPDLDAVTEQAYLVQEEKAAQAQIDKGPGGRAFYASMFPGGEDEKRCARLALYGVMNIPNPEAVTPSGRAMMGMGEAAEKQIVWRWGKLGLLLNVTVPEKEHGYMKQIGFTDKETWLSGYADAVMDIRPRWDAVLPVDVKSKSQAKIDAMKAGEISYDPDHYKQVQAYLYLCRKFHTEMGWDKKGLEPAKGGIIYYVSRDNPRSTWSAYVAYDEEFVNAGIERLAEWKEMYLNDVLPERPKEWKWTEPPCKWCKLKKMCKQDIRDDVTRLSESNTIQLAKKMNPNYDLEEVKKEVMRRWMNTNTPKGR